VFTNAELGLTFTPPEGLRDLTAALKEAEAGRPQDGRAHFTELLHMASGPDDTAPDWLQLGIETFPRGRDLDKSDDMPASFITNNAFAGGATVERKVVKFADRDFAMTHLEKKENSLTKHGIVFTTVHKEKFVTFFFAGNVREKVDQIAQSMSTVKFAP
jgi:hypothetical protein